jgi:hypothetical protein
MYEVNGLRFRIRAKPREYLGEVRVGSITSVNPEKSASTYSARLHSRFRI